MRGAKHLRGFSCFGSALFAPSKRGCEVDDWGKNLRARADRMTTSFHLRDFLATLAAYGGLLGGLLLLGVYPLVGVLFLLGSMALAPEVSGESLRGTDVTRRTRR